MCAPHGHPKRLEGSTNQGGRIGPERYFFSSPPGADLWLQGGTPRLILVGFRGNNFPVLGMERTQPPASSCQDHWGYFYPLFLKSHFSAAQGAAEEHQTSFPPPGRNLPQGTGIYSQPLRGAGRGSASSHAFLARGCGSPLRGREGKNRFHPEELWKSSCSPWKRARAPPVPGLAACEAKG